MVPWFEPRSDYVEKIKKSFFIVIAVGTLQNMEYGQDWLDSENHAHN